MAVVSLLHLEELCELGPSSLAKATQEQEGGFEKPWIAWCIRGCRTLRMSEAEYYRRASLRNPFVIYSPISSGVWIPGEAE